MASYQTAERISSTTDGDPGLPPVASYFATCDGVVIHEAGGLADIVAEINDTFRLTTEAVSVYSVWPGHGPRLVAQITAGKAGNRVRYVEGGAS